ARPGLFDAGVVGLPETFVVPQAVGGLLFGAGFLVAGLCPGTSCVAAAVGRLDGLAVVGGMFLGVVVFNAAYGWVGGIYESTALGAVNLPELLGVSRGTGT